MDAKDLIEVDAGSDKNPAFISVVVYIHDDESVVADTLKIISQTLSKHFSNIEMICVDDASTDNSAKQIRNVSTDLPVGSVSLIQMGHYHGLEKSMSAGVDKAVGDFVFEIDSTIIDYTPEMLIEIYNKTLEGFDIVSAAPLKAPTHSKLFYKLLSTTGENKYALTTETVRILTRRAINRIGGINKNIFYRKIVYAASGLKTECIIYDQSKYIQSGFNINVINNNQNRKNNANYNEPKHKKSNRKTRRARMNLAIDTLIIFTNLAYKISISLSIIMAVFMFAAGIYTIIAYIAGENIMEGWAPLMGLISAGFTGVFIILTALIKYFDILIKQTFYQRNYLVSSIDELK